MNSLLILGAGGHGKVVADLCLESGLSSLSFLDDEFVSHRPFADVLGLPVIGRFEDSLTPKLLDKFKFAFVAVSNPSIRLKWLARLSKYGYSLPSLFHSSATISSFANIGCGCIVASKAVIQAGASVADGCIVNTSASVDHDVRLNNGVHVCPGVHIAGSVNVGERSWLGIGSSLIQKVSIGDDVLIGAGSVVVGDIPSNVKAFGAPAQIRGPHYWKS